MPHFFRVIVLIKINVENYVRNPHMDIIKPVLFHLYSLILLNYFEVDSPVISLVMILPVMISPVIFLHD